jgi:putative colanic acid biosynthesis acetyltransferase WcaF
MSFETKIKLLVSRNTILKKGVNWLRFMHLGIANHFVNRIPSYRVRKYIYKHLYFMKIGKHSNIQMGVRFYAPNKITIGNNCSIGYNSLLDGRRGIIIKNNVDLAGEVRIMTLGHDLNDVDYKTVGDSVIINDNASIFMGASILPGRIIEKGSVIALGSIVTKNTESWCVYAGNPARKIGKRKINSLQYLRNYKRYFH